MMVTSDDRYEFGAIEALERAQESSSCLIGNRTGGQGKTLVSQLMFEALKDAGIAAALASVDTAHGDERSKLGALYPGALDLAVSADIGDAAAEGDGMAMLKHWDGFIDVLRQKNVVIDLGANVWPSIARWAEISKPARFIRGRPLNVLIIVTAQDASLRDGMVMLKQVEAAASHIDLGKIGIVWNEYAGAFSDSDPHVKALRDHAAKAGLASVSIKKGYMKATDMGVSISKLRTMDGAAYHKVRSSESEIAAWRELDFAQGWIEKAVDALRQAGFAPPKA